MSEEGQEKEVRFASAKQVAQAFAVAEKQIELDKEVIRLAEEFTREWLVSRDWEAAAERLAWAVGERAQFADWRNSSGTESPQGPREVFFYDHREGD